MSAILGWKSSIGIVALALAPAAAAQGQVWVVDAASGPGSDFTAVQPAVDAAAGGDAILVRAGSYPAFSIAAKALTLTAEQGDIVTVEGGIAIHDLSAGQHVVLRGIDAVGPAGGYALDLRSTSGTLWIEDGSFAGANDAYLAVNHAASAEDCAAVVLARCTFAGGSGHSVPVLVGDGGSGLLATRSSVAAYECLFAGGGGGDSGHDSDDPGGDGGHGVWQRGGFLYLSASACEGADGGFGGEDYDGFLGCCFSCSSGGAGGSGLLLAPDPAAPGTPAFAVRQSGTFTGGQGGPEDGRCDPEYAGPAGEPITIESGSVGALGASPTSLVATSPVRELQTTTLRFHGGAGDLAFALVSAVPEFAYLAGFQGVLAAIPGVVISAGAVPAGGTLLVPVQVPLLAPGLESVQLFAQGAFFRPATAEILLGAPSALWILHQVF
jgi:hypothetical protein